MERTHASSVILKCSFLLSVACLLSATAWGDISDTGTLATPQSVFQQVFDLTASGAVTFQTWGFGGGQNAAGNTISPGGFDPLIALFAGSGPAATIVTDGSGNPLADADNLLNSPWSPVGNCPPAGMVTIGTGTGSAVCGDDYMQATNLAAGVYTLVLSTADYIPNAVNPGAPNYSTIGDGFTDLSGPATGFGSGASTPYQTCNFTSDQPGGVCINPTGNYAVDIVGNVVAATPEPSTVTLLGAMLAFAGLMLSIRKRIQPFKKGQTR